MNRTGSSVLQKAQKNGVTIMTTTNRGLSSNGTEMYASPDYARDPDSSGLGIRKKAVAL